MSLTSKDIEEIQKKPSKEPRFTGFFLSILRLLMKIPLIKKVASESVGGLFGSIFRCWEHEDYEKATKIAIYALEKYKNKNRKITLLADYYKFIWWSFMRCGVDSAQHIENKELRNKLIEHAKSAIEPYNNYDAAYSYLEFSRWMYQSEQYDAAIRYAEIASNADITWAEPDFILGWYSLLLNKGNVEAFLSMAIKKDQRILFRISNNDICKQYPHILNKLKVQYHAQSGKSSNKAN